MSWQQSDKTELPTAVVLTFGCKVNQYDSNAMRSTMVRNGYQIVPETEPADVCLINTCTVTNIADQKARKIIRRVVKRNPEAKVLVTGCYAESDRQQIEQIEGVSLVFGNREKADLDQYLEYLSLQTHQPTSGLLQITPVQHDAIREHANFGLSVSDTGDRTRGIIKVQDGCSAFCTYCIIPYVRGRMTSRPISEIVTEVEEIAASGAKEIVITGVHLGSYGIDRQNEQLPKDGRVSIADILEQIHPVDGIERIRLSSIEPMNFPEDLAPTMAELPKCMPHFHLPLQAGSDRTLKRMRRRYTTDEFSKLTEHLRSVFPDAGLTTDIMVGFPGETDRDFEDSLRFVEQIGFSQLHVFRYSPRRGTPAAEYPDQLAPHISADRSQRMIVSGQRSSQTFRQQMVGKEAKVLIEDLRHGDLLMGSTGNYLRTAIDVPDSQINQVIPVTLTGVENGIMLAIPQS
ncbi:tRNA (N(6)-L-threonylcarbamoyladenosine(37)-C(2))-methylthiotransferase MtaB [Candidatus Poribacteria bacterium]|jgi:threonylcarbamoyladenosine tRNA methylthiotransferase MtaB|nr:tRNA (N(6)-L-threonylcarbamoyladenosine(37)-C(2))-methylthiotransferase MtaB [Candidatus Poribacteria bacterium]MDP6597961.1 tRNA (N(6)-L-threonylcarbamoyladenosine(37)-C(2))-methylthiotransferase MtaB [Candidatus Poribacteria bacterium]MDP6749544.1 tRNA (N(6)-L-threonylcarbamoyladenosine(37)-C(2))-methylthiotransferase MtaB [Candidatus Poribacteria bacterium]MDP6998274.1 tRNA (N(6)-L-threonylcarbamoyladenosine(37)-C(2))-methylthiotransferase MtaB [Candidatus Poribacteria bacterium]